MGKNIIKRILRTALVVGAALFLSVGNGSGCQDDGQKFTETAAFQGDAGDLRATTVSAHLDAPIQNGSNVIWCSTFQLAWNEVCKLAGGRVEFQGPEPPMATILNRRDVDAGDLDPASYFAAAGYVRDGIQQRIELAMKLKFPSADCRLLKQELALRPQDIIAYCYLFKKMDFAEPFEKIAEPLNFAGTDIVCFGMAAGDKIGHDKLAPQVMILDYRNPDDFIIELKTKSPGERLILAKISFGATLGETIDQVDRRISSTPGTAAYSNDVLKIPKMAFDITRNYTEVTKQLLKPTAPGMANDLSILLALQNIRFQMTEKGVVLQSEARMEIGCAAEPQLPPAHVMIFDKPFLLMMARAKSKRPYFACWIANPELLVKPSSKSP